MNVGLLDSGIGPGFEHRIEAARTFRLAADGAVVDGPATSAFHAHGTAIATVVAERAPAARLLIAQIFNDRLVTTAAQAAAGLDWLVGRQARIVNMSFGLSEDRSVLRTACEAACAAGTILLAASPARGAPVYPASYSGVLRITGDARCAPDEFSTLASDQADFGACVRGPDGALAGASIAVAYATAAIAVFLAKNGPSSHQAVRDHLTEIAVYQGPERRTQDR